LFERTSDKSKKRKTLSKSIQSLLLLTAKCIYKKIMCSNIEFEISHVEIVNKIDKIIVRKHGRVITREKQFNKKYNY